MKNITLSIDDETYRQARIVAAEQNKSLSALVREYLQSLRSSSEQQHREQVEALFAALDRGRNQEPVGRLRREELYDRSVLR